MAVGVGGMIVSGFLVGPLVRALGERRALLLGLACGALGFALQAWAPSRLWFWAGVPLVNLWSINGPAMQSLMVARVDASAQGQLQGEIQGQLQGQLQRLLTHPDDKVSAITEAQQREMIGHGASRTSNRS